MGRLLHRNCESQIRVLIVSCGSSFKDEFGASAFLRRRFLFWGKGPKRFQFYSIQVWDVFTVSWKVLYN